MPWVDVRHKGISDEALDKLSDNLQEIVARALHVPEVERAHLTPEDIELFIDEAGTRSKCQSINILIHTNVYLQRKKNIKHRTQQIAREVNELLNGDSADKLMNGDSARGEGVHGFIYIPSMGGFAEF